jgi:NADH-quinone oxidoreductase subunit N
MTFETLTLNMQTLLSDLRHVGPEAILAIAVFIIIIADLFLKKETSYHTSLIAIIALILSLHLLLGLYGEPGKSVFAAMLYVDNFAGFFKFIFLTSTLLVVLFSVYSRELMPHKPGEYYAILLGATLAMCLLVESQNFLMFFLALETLSISSYLLAGYLKWNRESGEAALKYLIYGAIASAIMLFGISYIYGMTGTLDIRRVFDVATANQRTLLLCIFLLLAGLGYKMAMVPFHFWVPDVYQGAPTPITAYLSVASKAAGFGAMLRIFLPFFQTLDIAPKLSATAEGINLSLIFWILSAATMTFGNLVAIRQTNIKRLLAYSSIAHAGYILMAMTVLNRLAMSAMLFYFVIYLFMNLGAFLAVVLLINRLGTAEIECYKGMINRLPFLTVSLVIFLFSLTGLPPTAGFIAKLNLFGALISEGLQSSGNAWFYYSLALIGVANSVVSLYYYMRIAKTMVLEESTVSSGGQAMDFSRPASAGRSLADSLLLLCCVTPILVFGVYWSPILKMIDIALLK